ncbi:MAG TPA: hypothetical protein PL163_08180 [Leptospiraceae bacterium]|nr:hypothetical protein [Leptospiraceae bacterium]HNM05442.1 hypothetical protein [Leptospiraceae bacterium]
MTERFHSKKTAILYTAAFPDLRNYELTFFAAQTVKTEGQSTKKDGFSKRTVSDSVKLQEDKMNKKAVLTLILFLSACVTGERTTYVKAEDAEASPEWGPSEIHSTVEEMASSMNAFFKKNSNPPYVEIHKLENRTSEHIDLKMLSNEISSSLLKKEIRFVDKSFRKEALNEIAMGQRGIIDEKSKIEAGRLVSPNFKLTGDISENVRFADNKKLQYLSITMQLIRLETGTVEWQDTKKFYKVTETPKIGM